MTYIIARGIFSPIYLLYASVMAEHCPYMVKFICLMILVQSGYYIMQMGGIIKKKYREFR